MNIKIVFGLGLIAIIGFLIFVIGVPIAPGFSITDGYVINEGGIVITVVVALILIRSGQIATKP